MGNELIVRWLGDVSSLEEASLKARGAVDKSSKSIASFGGVAKVVAGGAIIGLSVALDAGYKRWEEQQKVSAQTGAVLKSTGGAANVSAEEIEKLAKTLQNKSGVDKAAVQSGENLLLTFTNIRNEAGKGNDIFTRTTKATLDLATAMHEDMNTAAKQVGKALQDPLTGMTALRRVGVMFTADQKATIKALLDTGAAAKASAKEISADEKAVTAAQKALSAANAKVTSAQLAEEAATRAVTAAEDALSAATERATRAKDAITSATQHVSDARQHELDLVQKVKDAQQAEVDAIQRVKDAQTAEADAIQRVKDAQLNLVDSIQSEKDAQDALTQARVDATNSLIDMQNAAVDANLSQQSAEIQLQRAQEHLDKVMADSTSTDLDKREAQLQVVEAQQHLTEAQKQATDAANASNDAQEKGVEGSPQVIAAKKALQQAQELERKAHEEITRAQHAEARSAEAVTLAQQAQQKGARDIIQAQQDQRKGVREIVDAQRQLVYAQQDAADAQLKATRAAQALVVSQQAAARAHDNVATAETNVSKSAGTLTAAQKKLADAQERGKKTTVDHGNLLKAQKIILGELGKEFGGSAEAAGKTFPGQLQILKLKLLDLDEQLITKLMPSLTRLVTWLNTNLPIAIAKVSAFWDAHGKTIMKVATFIANNLLSQLRELGHAIELVSDILQGHWGAAWGQLEGIFKERWERFKASLDAALAILDAVFGRTVSRIGDKVDQIFGYFTALPGRIAGTLGDLTSTALSPFEGKFTAAKDWVGGRVDDVVGFFTRLPSRIAVTLADLVSTGLDAFTGKFLTAKNTVGGYINDLVGFFEKLPGRIAGTIGDLTGKAIEPFKDAFSRLGNALAKVIKAPLNAVIGAFNMLRIPGVHIHIPGPFGTGVDWGWDGYDFPDIPMLAEGGIVTRPTLAMVGERGPEAVVPLPSRAALLGGGGRELHVHLHLEGPVYGDDRRKLATELVDEMHRALIRKQNRNGTLGFA